MAEVIFVETTRPQFEKIVIELTEKEAYELRCYIGNPLHFPHSPVAAVPALQRVYERLTDRLGMKGPHGEDITQWRKSSPSVQCGTQR